MFRLARALSSRAAAPARAHRAGSVRRAKTRASVVARAAASAPDEVYRVMSANQEVAVIAVVGLSLIHI